MSKYTIMLTALVLGCATPLLGAGTDPNLMGWWRFDGDTLDTAPTTVKLWFSRAIESSFSKVSVVNTAGKRIDNDTPTVDDNEPKLIQVGLKPLPSGSYKVVWLIVAYDGHKAKGEFSFSVK